MTRPPKRTPLRLLLTRGRRRYPEEDPDELEGSSRGRRAAITLADQCLSSASNFAVGVVVARIAGPAGLGVFTLAYAGWLLLASMHRSLITDPMAIEGDARHPSNLHGIRRGIAAELILGAMAAIIFGSAGAILLAAGQHRYGMALLAVAPWLLALLVQDYWRWIGFMTAQPAKSLVNDLVFDAVEVAAFSMVLISHARGSGVILASWGVGALAGAVWGLRQHGVLVTATPRPPLRERPVSMVRFVAGGASLLRSRWVISRFIAANSLMNWGSSQAYVFIAGFILGPAGLGGLNSAQTLVTGPSGVLIQAGGSIGLPEASRSYTARGWPALLRVTRVVTAISVLAVSAGTIVVAVWGRTLLTVVYGPRFAHLQGTAVIFGVAQTVSTLGLGSILVLKATRNTRSLLYTVAVALVVSVGSVALLSETYGVNGAALASVVVSCVGVVGVRWFQHRAYRSDHDRAATPSPAPIAEIGAEIPLPSWAPTGFPTPRTLGSSYSHDDLERRA